MIANGTIYFKSSNYLLRQRKFNNFFLIKVRSHLIDSFLATLAMKGTWFTSGCGPTRRNKHLQPFK